MEEKVLELLKSKTPKLCTLATSNSQGKPESALMAYAILSELNLTLVLCTRTNTRKWENLKTNPQLSLVFGSGFREATVQYEGVAKLVDNPESLKTYGDVYFPQNPETLQFKGLPELGFIVITPTWIRFVNYSLNPPNIEEKTF